MYLISGNLKIMRWVRTASGISSFVSCALEQEACPTSSVICFSCAVCVYSLPVRQRCLFVCFVLTLPCHNFESNLFDNEVCCTAILRGSREVRLKRLHVSVFSVLNVCIEKNRCDTHLVPDISPVARMHLCVLKERVYQKKSV